MLCWLELLIHWCVTFDAGRGQSKKSLDSEPEETDMEISEIEREVGRVQKGRKTSRGKGSKGPARGKGKATGTILLCWLELLIHWCVTFNAGRGQSKKSLDSEPEETDIEISESEREVGHVQKGRKTSRGKGSKGPARGKGKATGTILLCWLELLIHWCVTFDPGRGQSKKSLESEQEETDIEISESEREVGHVQRGRKTSRGRGSKVPVTRKGKATGTILLCWLEFLSTGV